MQDGTSSAVLGDVGLALGQERRLLDRFIAHKIFPAFPVSTKRGDIPRLLARRRVQTVKRNKDGSFNRVETGADEVSYSCQEAGLEERLPDKDRVHFATSFDAEYATALGVARDLLRARDVALAAALFTTSTFGSGYNTAAIGTWGAASGSNPIKDIELAKEQIRTRIGIMPNRMVIGAGLWAKASYDPVILAQIKTLRSYAGDLMASQSRISLAVLAAVFQLEEVIVGEEIKDTSVEGQTSSNSDIWTNTYALPFFGTKTPELGDITLGRTFTWNPYLEQSTQGSESSEMNPELMFVADKYRENHTKSDVVRVEESNDMKLLCKDAGHLITGC
jgi:hypothetical protein